MLVLSAFKLWVELGAEIGVKKSSAQVTVHYDPAGLVGRQVAAVVNFPPRQIGKFISEVLVLGFPDADGEVVLVAPNLPVPKAARSTWASWWGLRSGCCETAQHRRGGVAIGTTHVWTPDTKTHHVWRLLLYKKKK